MAESTQPTGTRSRPPWYFYVLGLALLVYFVLFWYHHHAAPGLGFDVLDGEGAVLLWKGSQAERAGVQVGDRLVEIDGRPWNSVDLYLKLKDGATKTFRFRRNDRDYDVILTATSVEARPGVPTIGFTFLAPRFALLALALVIALLRPRDGAAGIGALFLAALSVFYVPPAGWTLSLQQMAAPVRILLFAPSLLNPLFGPLLLTFCAYFPRPFFKTRWVLAALCLPGFVTGSMNVFIVWSGSGASFADSSFRLGYATTFLYFVGGIAVLVLNYRRLRDVNERRRVRLLVFGSILLLLPEALFFLSFAAGFTAVFLFLASSTFQTIMLPFTVGAPIAFAYAIARHRVFDVRIIIRQGLQYAMARGVLYAALPLLGLILVLDLSGKADQPLAAIMRERGWAYLALGGVAVLLSVKRRQWLEWLDRRFFRDRYDAQRLLKDVIAEVEESRSLELAAPRVVAKIEAALHAESAAIVERESGQRYFRTVASAPAGLLHAGLDGESKLIAFLRLLDKPLQVSAASPGSLAGRLPHADTQFLRQERIDLILPVALGADRRELLLLLGPKRSEEPYSTEDEDLLTTIGSSLALLSDKRSGHEHETEFFRECLQCGTCSDSSAPRCDHPASRLARVDAPRLLASRYRLDRRIGGGGMGTVYAGTDSALERPVAVKLIRPDLAGNPGLVARFQQEAKTAAGLVHPNVVTIHDFGIARQHPFLVMEMLNGRTLRAEMDALKQLSPGRTLHILGAICSAIEEAHRRELIHRDLKPENIFLAETPAGEVPKVLDFGIAKPLTASSESAAATATGAIVGTPFYMSPEQLLGGAPSRSWDIWALGLIAYEMLTGSHAFAARSGEDWQSAVLSGRFLPVSSHRSDAPAAWQAFFEHVLDRRPGYRPDSVRGFRSQLEAALP